MKRRPVLVCIAVAVAALGIVAALLVRRPPPPFAYRFAWPAGSRFTYDLRWRASDKTTVLPFGANGDGPTFTSDLGLDAEWVVRSLGPRGDGWLLRVGFGAIRDAHLQIQGKPALADARSLRGHEAFVEVASDGTARQIFFAPDDPDVFKHLVSALVAATEVVVPATAGASEWTAEQRDMRGTLQRHYRVLAAGDPVRIDLAGLRYQALGALSSAELARAQATLAARGQARLARAGQLAALDGEQQLAVSIDGHERLLAHDELTLTLRRSDRFELVAGEEPDRAHLESRKPGEVVATAAMQRAMLEQRADGMTIDQALADLAQYGNGGVMPDESQWLWRVTGLLAGHPELCEQLLPLFQDEHTSTQGRALMLDLLASTGHPQAQATMVAALRSSAGSGDPRYGLLLQRLSLVDRATPETVRFLLDAHRNARAGDVGHATAYALGAVAAHADAATGRRIDEQLRDEVAQAHTPRDRELGLRALGNAQRSDDVDFILGYAQDPAPGVRQAAAAALRSLVTPAATETLLQLGADPHPAVGETALQSLGERPLTQEQLHQLAHANRLAEGELVTLLTRHLGEGPAAAEVLHTLLDRTLDPRLKARIRTLLGPVAAHW